MCGHHENTADDQEPDSKQRLDSEPASRSRTAERLREVHFPVLSDFLRSHESSLCDAGTG